MININPTDLAGKASAWLMAVLAVGLCSAALFYGGKYIGHVEQRADCKVEKAKADGDAAKLANDQLVSEQKRGADIAAALRAELDAQRATNDDLNRRLAHVPRLVSSPACPDAAAAQLSVAGLLRWNSALGYPGVPSTTCGTDTASAGACAAGSGATVDDAQTNAEVNFGRCAEIRTRCLAAIEYLKSRQTGAPVPNGAMQ